MNPHARRHLWSLVTGFALLGLVLMLNGGLAQDKEKEQPKQDPKVDLPKPKGHDIKDVLVGTSGGLQHIYLINETLEKAWAENKLVPADRASDYEFIRRASLDIIGRIAKPHEIERFFRDPVERRRSMLIERLLGMEKGPLQTVYAQEYADNFATIWTNLLMTRSGTAKQYQKQIREWLHEQLMEKRAGAKTDEITETPDWSKIVGGLLTASGETNENAAVNYILAHLGDAVPGDARAKADNGAFDMVPVTSRTTKLFLGLRTQCVQCHDHPFNDEWGQHHFWGINAFFRQVDAPKGRLGAMMAKGAK
jgi:hypothetical protein